MRGKLVSVSGMQWDSAYFVRFVFHPCICRNPVYFPRLASIIRECLFKTARIWRDVRDNEANKDGSTIKGFLIVKLAAPIFEFADCGLAQGTTDAVGKIEAPLAGFRIV